MGSCRQHQGRIGVGTELLPPSSPSSRHSYSQKCLSQWPSLVGGGSLNSEGRSGTQDDYLKLSKASTMYSPWRRWTSIDSECLCFTSE